MSLGAVRYAHREVRPVLYGVDGIRRPRIPPQVLRPVVRPISVVVAHHVTGRARAKESHCDKPVHKPCLAFPVAAEDNCRPPLAVYARGQWLARKGELTPLVSRLSSQASNATG